MSAENDLAALRAFLPEFESYLKSDTLFWTVSANLPALTVGGLLLARRRLEAWRAADQLSQAQMQEFDQLDGQASLLFNQWPVNIEKKAVKEFHSRLNVWADALTDLGDGYATAVTPRVYLGLLAPLVGRQAEGAALQSRLSGLDARLRSKITPGAFVWDAALTRAFPTPEFWYLYGKPSAGARSAT